MTKPESDLVAALGAGLPLSSHPFAEVGRACNASEDEVLERLRRLLGQGVVCRLQPLPAPARAGAAAAPAPAADSFDARLLEALEIGFPLLPRPYEAVAAMLGTTEPAVLEHLQRLLDAGLIGRIGMQLCEPGPGAENVLAAE